MAVTGKSDFRTGHFVAKPSAYLQEFSSFGDWTMERIPIVRLFPLVIFAAESRCFANPSGHGGRTKRSDANWVVPAFFGYFLGGGITGDDQFWRTPIYDRVVVFMGLSRWFRLEPDGPKLSAG